MSSLNFFSIKSYYILLYTILSYMSIHNIIKCYNFNKKRCFTAHFVQKGVVINMKPLKKKVSITLDIDLIEEIKRLSEEEDRSFSQYINMLIKRHLKKLEKTD